ncbi:MAG: methylenetetrahydrofolate reductase [Lentisphaerae bacterium]|jgi:methylenetetrahydrofolate reductase (NADPH)|nr:methylenetetrahydrofolate reductase [Lentisphaerota bacterium]
MATQQYKTGSQLEKLLVAGEFVVTAELGPPKSADLAALQAKIESLRGYADAVNVTDNQAATVRVASMAVARLLVEQGLEPVMQMTCRDRNRLALQADILGAYVLGIRNLLCLTGDHPRVGNHPTAAAVYDLDALQLIQLTKNMRDRKIFANAEEIRNSAKEEILEPRMFIGAAANPFAEPLELQIDILEKKIAAGADFIQTQCVYDIDRFQHWLEQVRARGLHQRVRILAGLTPLKSVGMAKYMRDKVPGIILPPAFIARLERSSDPQAEGIQLCLEQIAQLRRVEGLAGIHLMAIGWEHRVAEIIKPAGLWPRPAPR